PDDGADSELQWLHDGDAVEVAEALGEARLVLGADEHDRTRELSDHRNRLFRGRRVELRRVDHCERAVARVARERRAQCRLDDLAIDLLLEAAGRLREGVAAALEL